MLKHDTLKTFRRVSLICLAIAAGWVSAVVPANAESRFPKPDFTRQYEMPVTTTPAPRTFRWEYIDLAVLVAVLSLSVLLALRLRSRRGILLLTVFSVLYFGFYRQGCICSVGSLQNVTLSVFDTSYELPLTVAAFFILPLAFALLFGRVFCGAACPLGTIQDLVVLRPVKLPLWLNALLSTLPYLYLGIALLYAATSTGFIICRFDPFVPFFRMTGAPWILAAGGIILLTGTVVGRPYCRFLCPYGVLLKWMSRLSWRHLSITPDECIKCRLCEDSCPFDAIRKPSQGQPHDTRRGIRRLLVLLLAVPLFALAGGFAGYSLAPGFSRGNTAVALAEQVVKEGSGEAEGETVESHAFRLTGRTTQDLMAEVAVIRRNFAIGGLLFGCVIGLVFSFKMIGLSVFRKQEFYEPDRGECISCGRCMAYCPREQLRLGRTGKGSESR